MNYLLTADFHLTDTPLESYRWDVFKFIEFLAKRHDIGTIIIAGDITDRKDRHTGNLTNRLCSHLDLLQENTKAEIFVLAGNHDAPITGTYYWNFLNLLGVHYIQDPTVVNGIYLLPFSKNPMEDWKQLKLTQAKAIVMHQTVMGAIIDGGRKIESNSYPLPVFPRTVSVFSGDVHRPQAIAGVTYIGTPHPTRFSEDWRNRVLIIKDDNFKHPIEEEILSIRRAIVEIRSADELKKSNYTEGDQLKIRFQLSPDNLTDWPDQQQAIQLWAKEKQVTIASLEAVLVSNEPQVDNQEPAQSLELLPPDQIIRTYGEQQKLSDDIIQFGLDLVKECQ